MWTLQSITILGAAGFGAIIGWLVYYINRYRKSEVQFSDLTTIIGIVGGAAVTSLFGDGDKVLFGAYGMGLFVGFFGYFIALLIMVRLSNGVFSVTWFLDGRRKMLASDETLQGEPEAGNRAFEFDPGLGARVAGLEAAQADLTAKVNQKS